MAVAGNRADARAPARATAAFLFTDIEGSTRLLSTVGEDAYQALLRRHMEIVERAIADAGGRLRSTEGDATFSTHATVGDAIDAAVDLARGLALERWSEGHEVKVRSGVHVGEVISAPGQPLVGMAIHTAARIGAAPHGGQILVSRPALDLVTDLRPDVRPRSLGTHRLKDIGEPIELIQLCVEGLPDEFPPLKSLGGWSGRRPETHGEFVGRDDELARIRTLLSRGERLVTLVGRGGIGKSRLALESAAVLAAEFADRVVFVPLAGVDDASGVVPAVAGVLDAAAPSIDAIGDAVGPGRFVIVLDNLEQIEDVGDPVDAMLSGLDVAIVATSQRPLRHEAEFVCELDPLGSDDAVALFAARATRVGVPVSTDDPEVRDVCARLEGVPLALELTAARLRRGSGDALSSVADVLAPATEGGRHESLAATIRWTYDLLPDSAKAALARLSVLSDDFTAEFAADVIDTDEAKSTLDVLIDFSLLQRSGARTLRMLDTIRRFAADRLEEGSLAEQTLERRDEVVRELASRAAVELGGAGQLDWLDRLDVHRTDVLAAIDRMAEKRPEQAVETITDLEVYWELRGQTDRVADQLDRLIPDPLPADPAMTRAVWFRLCCRHPAFRAGRITLRARTGGSPGEIADIFRAASDAGDRLTAARAAQVLLIRIDFDGADLGDKDSFAAETEELRREALPAAEVIHDDLVDLTFGRVINDPGRLRAFDQQIALAVEDGDRARAAAIRLDRVEASHPLDPAADDALRAALRDARSTGSDELEIRALRGLVSSVRVSDVDAIELAARAYELLEHASPATVEAEAPRLASNLDGRGLGTARAGRSALPQRVGTSDIVGHLGYLAGRWVRGRLLPRWVRVAELVSAALCLVGAAVSSGQTRVLLAGAGGLLSTSLVQVVRTWNPSIGPRAPSTAVALIVGCAVGRPGVGVAFLLVVGAFPFAGTRNRQLVSVGLTVLGALAWWVTTDVAVLGALAAKSALSIGYYDEPPTSIVRRLAIRWAITSGAVLVAAEVATTADLAGRVSGSLTDASEIAVVGCLLLTAVMNGVVSLAYGALGTALAATAGLALFGAPDVGLALAGLVALAGAVVIWRGGAPLDQRTIERARRELAGDAEPVMPPNA